MSRRSSERAAPRPRPRPGGPLLVFLVALAVGTVAWGAGFALRGAIWSEDIETVRRSGIFRIYGLTISEMTNTFLLLVVVSAAYLACLWALRKGFRHSFAAAVAGSALLTVAILPVTPLTSPDAVHFAADVRTLWLHGSFPGSGLPGTDATVPSEVDDPVAAEVRVFRDAPSSYGPVTYVISGVTLPLVGDNLRANVFGVKVVAGVFLVLTAALSGLVARRLGKDAGVAAAFVGMNPLMLWQFPGDGHNDTIMAAFGMLALMLVMRADWPGRAAGAGAALLSVLAKYALAAAAPLIVAYWFPRLRYAIAAVVFVAGAAAGLSFLFGFDIGLREIGPAAGLSRNTPWAVLSRAVDATPETNERIFGIAYLLFTVVAVAIVARLPLRTPADLAFAVALLLFAFLFIGAPSLRHWYQVWYLPFVAVCGVRWLSAAAITFSVGSFVTVLALNWASEIKARMGIGNPVDPTVVALWICVAAVAVTVFLIDRGRTVEAAATRPGRRRGRASSRRTAGSRV